MKSLILVRINIKPILMLLAAVVLVSSIGIYASASTPSITFSAGQTVVTTELTEAEITDLFVENNHTVKDHSPNIAGSQARGIIERFLLVWAAYSASNGNDPRNNCGELRDAGGNLIKVAFQFFDETLGQNTTLWYWAKTPGTPWGGAYPKDPAVNSKTFEDGPTLKDGWTWTTGPDICKGVGNFVPGLQVAQP